LTGEELRKKTEEFIEKGERMAIEKRAQREREEKERRSDIVLKNV
jgi:hypothetical protein